MLTMYIFYVGKPKLLKYVIQLITQTESTKDR